MSRGFQKVLEEIARAARGADRSVPSHAMRGRKSMPLEWQIRERSLLGDRIVVCLGFALAVSSMSFLVYAFEVGGSIQPLTLVLPRVTATGMVDRSSLPRQRYATVEDPESTGALPRTLSVENPGPAPAATDRKDAATGLRAYTIRRAFQGFATLAGPDGMVDVVPGVEVPGAGKILSIEKVAGQWVVETSEGFIRTESR